jgi:hypothetical protein
VSARTLASLISAAHSGNRERTLSMANACSRTTHGNCEHTHRLGSHAQVHVRTEIRRRLLGRRPPSPAEAARRGLSPKRPVETAAPLRITTADVRITTADARCAHQRVKYAPVQPSPRENYASGVECRRHGHCCSHHACSTRSPTKGHAFRSHRRLQNADAVDRAVWVAAVSTITPSESSTSTTP